MSDIIASPVFTDYTAAWIHQIAWGGLGKSGSWVCLSFHFLPLSVLPYYFNHKTSQKLAKIMRLTRLRISLPFFTRIAFSGRLV